MLIEEEEVLVLKRGGVVSVFWDGGGGSLGLGSVCVCVSLSATAFWLVKRFPLIENGMRFFLIENGMRFCETIKCAQVFSRAVVFRCASHS